MQVCTAHKGFAWLEIETRGRAAHGSQYQIGVDANLHMGRVIGEMEKLLREIYDRKHHPLLGPGSFHVSTIEGGAGLSTYSERCVIQLERRTLPGETQAQVVAEYQEILDRLSSQDPDFKASLKTLLVRSPFEVSEDAAIVKAIQSATSEVIGATGPVIGENPWMDSAILSDAGIETVVMGPAGTGAHALEEWVDVQSVIDFTRVLAKTALNYCQPV